MYQGIMDIFTALVTAVILLMKVDKQDVSFLRFIVYFDFDSLRKTFVNFSSGALHFMCIMI